jgi:hypothetical protein
MGAHQDLEAALAALDDPAAPRDRRAATLRAAIEGTLRAHRWQLFGRADAWARELIDLAETPDDLARSSYLLGTVHLASPGATAEGALQPLTDAAEILDRSPDPDPVLRARTHERLALALERKHRWAEAASALERAAPAMAIDGVFSADQLPSIRWRLLDDLERAGRIDDAVSWMEGLAPSWARALGPDRSAPGPGSVTM